MYYEDVEATRPYVLVESLLTGLHSKCSFQEHLQRFRAYSLVSSHAHQAQSVDVLANVGDTLHSVL